MIQTASTYIANFREATAKNKNLGKTTGITGPVSWRPPPPGIYKIN
jgi:hypothetical protein